MKTTRSALVALFLELDFKTASKWNQKRMMSRVKGMPENVDENMAEDLTEDSKKLFHQIFDAVDKGEEIEVEPNPKKKSKPTEEPSQVIPDPPKPKVPEKKSEPKKKSIKKSTKKGKKTVPKKTKKKTTPKKSTKKSTKKKPIPKKKPTSSERDRWGARIGTKAARINACFSKKEKLPGDIGRELRLTSFHEQCCVRGYIYSLAKRGWVIQGKKKGTWKQAKGKA